MLPRMVLVAILLSPAAWLPAQSGPPGVFDLAGDREPMVVLDGSWRFHAGDDSRWADPAFDDSHWSVLKGNQSWDTQGYPGLSGFGWYRATLLIPASAPPLALYVPRASVRTDYQAFADGRPLEGCTTPLTEQPTLMPAAVCPLGPHQSGAAHTVVLAIRVWHWPHWASYYGGGLLGGLRVGGLHQIQHWADSDKYTAAWSVATRNDLLAIIFGLAGLSAIGFFTLRPREKEYLWFGVYALVYAAIKCQSTFDDFHSTLFLTRYLMLGLLQCALGLSFIGFYLHLLRGRRNWLFWAAVATQAANLLFATLAINEFISVAFWNELGVVQDAVLGIWVVSLLVRRAIDGFPDARLLLVPAIFQPLVSITSTVFWIFYVVGWYRVRPAWLNDTFHWPFPFALSGLADFIFLITMVAILILRFNRTTTQRERLTAELEAARTVQQILVPEEIPPIAGFAISSVYHPAGEVGGDFFQILPARSGGVLIVLGDVSGKGMPAAMVVSLLVGTVRTLAHYTDEPGQMLEAMNQRMLSRSQGGFTTCLILRADDQGMIRAANAGHLSPYVAGREISLESGLPLGLDASATYIETAFHLDEHQQLTLVTDGVLEARSRSGELLGFERLKELSVQPADKIAESARQFGQDDDITVLTLMRLQNRDQAPSVLVNTELASG
jgi:Stage II sporulation protein E (SpoIIE)